MYKNNERLKLCKTLIKMLKHTKIVFVFSQKYNFKINQNNILEIIFINVSEFLSWMKCHLIHALFSNNCVSANKTWMYLIKKPQIVYSTSKNVFCI